MTSVFRIYPDDLYKKMKYLNYLKDNTYLNFLEPIKDEYNINVEVYYNIVNGISEYKLKNLIYFFNIRLLKINKKIKYDNKETYESFNDKMNKFIDNDIVNCIIIMNMIQHYIYPMR
tara:strand:+ start:377 stop:727 length:351 start_codon:yes stop_codon:yes gene_type:complete